MKIQMKTCTECGASIGTDHKGYVDGCDQCSKPKANDEQEKKWEADGNFFVNCEGEEIHYEVVRRFSVSASL